MKKSDFTYYMHDGPAAFSFELAGTLSADDATKLEQSWLTASSVIGDRILVVDLSFVTRVEEAGRDLLRRWHQNGATLVANSPTAQLLAESIIGAPLPTAAPALAPTYAPFFMQLTRRATTLLTLILLTLLHPATASGCAMPGCWPVPQHRQQLLGTLQHLALVSPFTPALTESQTSGL